VAVAVAAAVETAAGAVHRGLPGSVDRRPRPSRRRIT